MSWYRVFLSHCISLFTIDITGLDPARYHGSAGGTEERSFASLDSQMLDTERFKDTSPFLVRCRHCQGELSFAPLNDREVRILIALPFLHLVICLEKLVLDCSFHRPCLSRLPDSDEHRKHPDATGITTTTAHREIL